MTIKPPIESTLKDKTVALPESRQLDVLTGLFERRQAKVIRVPMVTILDSPDQDSVIYWLKTFIDSPPRYFVILTGEGLRRLISAAERNKLKDEFIYKLSLVLKISRGPKPVKALKEVGLNAEYLGKEPTTAGVIATLESLNLKNKDIAVQLYGTEPNISLIDYLRSRGVSNIRIIAPYIYSEHSDSLKVIGLVKHLYADKVDLIAFTSKPQVKRLFSVAREHGLEGKLIEGLARTHVAAIGPIMQQELKDYRVDVSVAPEVSYSMKPLVKAAESLFN
ncbi:MAG: uroporphyrinogen III synthase [Gammaproteobacteria bacterium]|nr:uroporphyrinogen III synthase [Gammaproteobacteria bacterium]|tara:strand:- start:154 stop:987 length:834 start_codon:yes stop_codon:yes gene_type:complete